MQPETDAEQIARLERRIAQLEAENERLRRALEEALRTAKRQAGPSRDAIPRPILPSRDVTRLPVRTPLPPPYSPAHGRSDRRATAGTLSGLL